MLEKSVEEDCCKEVLEKRVVDKSWRRVLEEKRCREVLYRSVVEKCWRRFWRRGL